MNEALSEYELGFEDGVRFGRRAAMAAIALSSVFVVCFVLAAYTFGGPIC